MAGSILSACNTIYRAKKYFLKASRRQGTRQYNPGFDLTALEDTQSGTTAACWWRGELRKADEGGRSCDLNVACICVACASHKRGLCASSAIAKGLCQCRHQQRRCRTAANNTKSRDVMAAGYRGGSAADLTMLLCCGSCSDGKLCKGCSRRWSAERLKLGPTMTAMRPKGARQ